jgi:hypothetical protein
MVDAVTQEIWKLAVTELNTDKDWTSTSNTKEYQSYTKKLFKENCTNEIFSQPNSSIGCNQN